MNIKEVIEKKGKLLEQLKEAVNAKDFDQAKVDAISEDITKLDQQKRSIENAQELLANTEQLREPEIKEDSELKRFDDFIRGKIGKNTEFEFEARANQFYKGTANKGGSLVPDLVGTTLAEARAHVGGMITPGLCSRKSVANGQKITFLTVDDTSTKSAIIGEKTTMATGTDVTYGTATFEFYKLTSAFVKVSRELIDDSIFDVVGHVIGLLAKRQARGENYYFTLGTGSSMPYGIQSKSTKGKDAASPRAVTRDELVDLIHSVDRAYRDSAVWQMNDATVAAIRKLAISDTYAENAPLWQDSMRAGEPSLLEGYPVIVNSQVDKMEAYNQSIFFGDFSEYLILEAAPYKVTRVDELYAATDEIGFNITSRIAGNLLSGGAPIKHIRQPST